MTGRVLARACPCALARRGVGRSERRAVPEAVTPTRNGGIVTFVLPASNWTKNVWSFLWRKFGGDSKRRGQRNPGGEVMDGHPGLGLRKRGAGRYLGFVGETPARGIVESTARSASRAIFPGRGMVIYSCRNGCGCPV